MLFCFFEYRYISVLHLTFFEIFLSLKLDISSIEFWLQSVWHSLSLRNNLFVLTRRIAAIFERSHLAMRN